jgi:polyisoprenyl-phosphate glycosyltransferase
LPEISIVIPVRDEEKNIGEVIKRISSSLDDSRKTFEILFVTDINKDNTIGLLDEFSKKHPNIKALKLSNSFGQHVAVMAGLDHCQGNYIVIMDGDLQDYPEDIPLLYNKITEGFDVVYAIKETKDENWFRNFSSRTFNSLMNSLSDFKMQSNSSMFRIISRKALIEITRFREFEPSLTYIFSYINLPTTTVKVRSGVRQQGKTKYSFFRLVSFAISSLLSFSRKPLRFIASLGLIMSAFSFLYFMIVLYQYFSREIEILGWATIIAIVTFMGGIQLLSIGVIGEYIGRMYIQTKNRPLYIIEKKYGNFDQ